MSGTQVQAALLRFVKIAMVRQLRQAAVTRMCPVHSRQTTHGRPAGPLQSADGTGLPAALQTSTLRSSDTHCCSLPRTAKPESRDIEIEAAGSLPSS